MLNSIKLQKFRNYKELSLSFKERTLFYGKNGQGKTNILEAIYLLSSAKSFRSKDEALLKAEEEFFVVEGSSEKDLRLVIQRENGILKKKLVVQGRRVKGKDFLKGFYAVLFSPEDVELITASPSMRRRYLDIILCKFDTKYTLNLLEYKKVLLQRNALLKSIKEGRRKEEELDIWDERLVLLGEFLSSKREELVLNLNEKLKDIYKNISGEEGLLKIKYKRQIKDADDFEEKLKSCKAIDIRFGNTTTGPHRDDFSFIYNDKNTEDYSSRGELRTMVLSLKLSEGEYAGQKIKKDITYLLDDVFSELDRDRREALMKEIEGKQVIITTTDLDHISKDYQEKTDLYEIKDGEVVK